MDRTNWWHYNVFLPPLYPSQSHLHSQQCHPTHFLWSVVPRIWVVSVLWKWIVRFVACHWFSSWASHAITITCNNSLLGSSIWPPYHISALQCSSFLMDLCSDCTIQAPASLVSCYFFPCKTWKKFLTVFINLFKSDSNQDENILIGFFKI